MSDTFISEYFKVVVDILAKSGNAVYADPELGLILVQTSDNPGQSYEMDDEKKKKILRVILQLGTPEMEFNELEQLITQLLQSALKPLDRMFVARLIVLLLTLYDERTGARINGTTIEFWDRYQQGTIDLDLEELS